MKKINLYFLIGTLGMLFTAMANILLVAFLPETTFSFSFLYPVFTLFLIFGTVVMIRRKIPADK